MLFEREPDSKNVYFGDREGETFGLKFDGAAALIIIGPEAGFSKSEQNRLESVGATAISFGRHNLRIETAAVAAMTAANLVKGRR
jgi:RsmE family RNA methyltransferase